MKVKELVEELLKLDQEKRISISRRYDSWNRWLIEPHIQLSYVDSDNQIVFQKQSVETVYEITEK